MAAALEGVLALGVSVGILALLQGLRKRRETRRREVGSNKYPAYEDDFLLPPLPDAVVSLLQISRLCFLATQADGEPHLSLMNFTYCQSEELIIFCTRRNTKKYDQMLECPNVAILVHDFPHLATLPVGIQHGRSYSITLNGKAIPLPRAAVSERYRQIHLQNNQDYAQFIVGDDIAVILVKVNSARLCDIKDNVTQWSGVRVGEGTLK